VNGVVTNLALYQLQSKTYSLFKIRCLSIRKLKLLTYSENGLTMKMAMRNSRNNTNKKCLD